MHGKQTAQQSVSRPDSYCAGKAAKQLNRDDLDIQDASRDEVVVDSDTQGIPGSPPLAETIFQKIKESDAFVADLTPTHTGPCNKVAPNPNVLIEYGYAHHALGVCKIVGVFNEAFGKPDDFALRSSTQALAHQIPSGRRRYWG